MNTEQNDVKLSANGFPYYVVNVTQDPPLGTISHYRIEESFIRTIFSIVYLGSDMDTGRKVVLKFIKRIEGNEERNQTEISILQNLSHPNIIKFLDAFEYKEFTVLITPFATGGSLFTNIKNNYVCGFPEETVRDYLGQMLETVLYLHRALIIHRDIKLENFLIFKELAGTSRIVMIDFGLAKQLKYPDELCDEKSGTCFYIPPEIISKKPYTNKVDIWSLGVTAFGMLSGTLPFYSKKKKNLNHLIMLGKFIFHDARWLHISNDAKDLIKNMLKVDPEERFSAEQCLRHPFFTNAPKGSTISSMLSAPFQSATSFFESDAL